MVHGAHVYMHMPIWATNKGLLLACCASIGLLYVGRIASAVPTHEQLNVALTARVDWLDSSVDGAKENAADAERLQELHHDREVASHPFGGRRLAIGALCEPDGLWRIDPRVDVPARCMHARCMHARCVHAREREMHAREIVSDRHAWPRGLGDRSERERDACTRDRQ